MADEEVKDVNPIIDGIELETYEPAKGSVFRQPDEVDTGSIGNEFHPEDRQKKSRKKTLLKAFIAVAIIVAIVVVIICLVIFLGPETKGPTTKAPTRATPTRTTQTGTPVTVIPTIIPGVVIGDVNVELTAKLNGVDFIPEFMDPSSSQYMEFASNAEAQIMSGLQNNQIGGYIMSVDVNGLSPGSVVMDVAVGISGAIGMTLAQEATNATSAFEVQLAVANEVSTALNDAVTTTLSNNAQLGSSDAEVEIQQVLVPVTAGGTDLPNEITPGETCDEGFFRCTDGLCIHESLRCDYEDHCATGEDEQLCGECTSDQFQCGNGKCIPDYYVCNYWPQCQGLEDEIGCGQGQIVNITLVQGIPVLVQSPTYPNPYPAKENSYWAITTEDPDLIIGYTIIDIELRLGAVLNFENGTDLSHPSNDLASYHYRFHPEGALALQTNAAFMFFYPGPYPGGRGFVIEFNAIDPSTFTPAACQAGHFQCASDGECIPSLWQCDDITDCSDETDEDVEVCANQPAPGECVIGNNQFQCGDGSCIHAIEKCDWFEDCPGGEDELYCDCDPSNTFQCGPTSKCIPDFWVCNWFFDCDNRADETACGGPAFTDERFLSPGESVNFTSPNFPNAYGSDVYYLFTFETKEGYQIQIDIYQFSTALGGFTSIGDGLDPTNHNSALLYLNHYSQVPTSSSIRVTSTSFTLWLEIHGGPYGFDVLYASATSIQLTCEDNEYICPGYCIPDDFKCDFWHDCLNGEDEMGCGHEERIDEYTLDLDSSQVFTSPNYSTPYVGDHGLYFWSFDASAVVGDYIIRFTFHPYNISASSYVAFGSGLDFTNQSSFYAVYAGQDDLDLHHHYSTENQVWVEFYVGGEETPYPGFSATAELILRLDQCAGNQFQCPDLSCIPLFYQCDFYPDCVPGYTDELVCPHPPTVHQEVVVDTSYDFTSPLYPENYIGNSTFFPYTFSTSDPSKHIMFEFSVFQVGIGGALSFGIGHDYFDFSSTFDVFHASVPPTTVYAQSDRVWAEFYSGFTDGQGFHATVSTYPAGLIPPQVVCDSSQWACADGLYCIPLRYRCDGHHDCPSNGEDEHGCPSNCREYQFECKNGECLPEHSQCNGFPQCSEGEDELGCGHQGDCTDQQFQCFDGTCIPSHQRCNYFYDCQDGSDESQAECGACNDLDSYTCNVGNCIPSYWQCDFYADCQDGDDEMQCHFLNDPTYITLALGEQFNITSEKWPQSADPAIYQLWHITAPEGALIHFDFLDFDLGLQSFIVFSDGHMVADHSNEWAFYSYRFNPGVLLSHNNNISVQYYSGAYVGTRGFFISMKAVHDGHVHPSCADTAYQCANDSECIPLWWKCDGYPDCLTGDDEFNCTYAPPGECGVHADEYRCNNTDICFPGAFRCDYMSDCPEHDDEFDCTCTGNEFKCSKNGQCLPNHFACDFFYDCGPDDRSDEIEGCGTPSTLLEKTLVLEELFTITSTNYPNSYPARDFLVYIITAPDDYVVRVIFNDYSIDWKGFLAFGHGDDYHDHDKSFAVYNHHDKNPVNFYTPTNHFYIVFYGGPYGQSPGFNISMIPIAQADTPTVTPPGTCEPGQFACFDGTCLPGIYECDGVHDCDQSEDEARCYANGGTCQSHQFTCNDGVCIHEEWRCDLWYDCAGGEDEDVGCPFRCFSGQFACEASETCIPQQFTCDYYPDCDDGADETVCGSCGEGFFNCSDGACVPNYYVCDAYNDCVTETDEDSCGTIENTEYITLGVGEERTIQSPGYPNAADHDAHCYVEWIVNVPNGYAIHLVVNDFSIPPQAWLQMGTGDDADNDTSLYAIYYASTNPREIVLPESTAWISYHCGAVGLARGFSITIRPTNITTHNYTACEANEFQCNDGHCIPSHYLCDNFKDCSQEEDENHILGRVNCSSFNHYECGTFDSQYECPSGLCIHSDWRCDGDYDCPSGADETLCAPCEETEFECPHQQCISGNYRCDFFPDCLDGLDDELNCGTPDTTTYIYLSQNSTNITSVNYPYDYKSNENYEIIIRVDPGRAILVTFYDINLSIGTYLAFGHGNDPEDFSNLFESYSHHSTVPPEFNSITNEMFIKFHSGPYGDIAGYFIGLQDVDPLDSTHAPCDEDEFQCPSDGACIPLIWECDDIIDCGFSGDEINCQAPEGGVCKEHHFTCNNSECIRASWQCDNFNDCSDNSDEENCPFTGCGNFPFVFECDASFQCIFDFQRCNHVADCDLGEDEADCGACQNGFFTCSNGGCVPDYWRCDGDNDCFDGGDEMNCGTIGTIENIILTHDETQQVSSPGYPMRYGTLCYVGWQVTVPVTHYVRFEFVPFDLALSSYVTVGTGLDHSAHDTIVAEFRHNHEPRQYVVQSNEAWLEFHCGPYGGGQGFQIIISAIDPETYIHPTCPSDEYQCADGNCIETFDLCNGVKDCLGGEDEDQDCDNFDHFECGTNDNKFVCHTPSGPYCIYPQDRCNGQIDCYFFEDEKDCECDDGEFQCVESKLCIPATFYCDNFFDCSLTGVDDTSDESSCAHINNTVSYTLTNPINITSPNYPGDYVKNDYTLTLITAPEGMIVRARVLDLALSHSTFIIFLNGHDTDLGNSNILASLEYGDNVTEILSYGNEMAIKFYSGFYGQARGFLIELSYMAGLTCAPDEFTCEEGGCFDYRFVCDLFPDCQPNAESSDESDCQVPAGEQCHPSLFTCNDGMCIPLHWKCDAFLDCSENEDEANCPVPDP